MRVCSPSPCSAADGVNQSVEEYLKANSKASLTPLTATPTTTLSDAVQKMVDAKVHRLWVVNEANEPVGVASLTDVFKVVRDHDDGGAPAKEHDRSFVVHKTYTTNVRAASGGLVLAVNNAGDGVGMQKASDDNAARASWTVEHGHATRIKLKSASGKYLAVDAKHVVGLADSSDSDDTTLELVEAETGFVALRSAHGGFLEPHGEHVQCKLSKSKKGRPTKRQLFKLTGTFASTK